MGPPALGPPSWGVYAPGYAPYIYIYIYIHQGPQNTSYMYLYAPGYAPYIYIAPEAHFTDYTFQPVRICASLCAVYIYIYIYIYMREGGLFWGGPY